MSYTTATHDDGRNIETRLLRSKIIVDSGKRVHENEVLSVLIVAIIKQRLNNRSQRVRAKTKIVYIKIF